MFFKKNGFFIVFLVLIIALIIFVLLARNFKSRNSAVVIKQFMDIGQKKKLRPWSKITHSTGSDKTIVPLMKTNIGQLPIETQTLAISLEENLRNIDNADLVTLKKNIDLANELISRVPDSYSAYKGKLISLLALEGKYNQTLDEIELENLLETMATFDTRTQSQSRREAILISNSNKELDDAIEALDELAARAEQVSTIFEEEEVLTREQVIMDKIDSLRNRINQADILKERNIDEDILVIPFMRMMAKNEFLKVEQMASSFIGQFPDSPHGYYFLIKAFESEDRTQEALDTLLELPVNLQNQIDVLKKYDLLDYKTYWKRLYF
jgi:hypothetical protein